MARENRKGMNQSTETASAEKLSAMETAELFAERKKRADFDAFNRILRRKGGQKPVDEDILDGYS